MRVTEISSKKFLHVAKRKLVNAQELNSYLKAEKQTNQAIGTLPFDFLKHSKKADRGNITQKAIEIFANFAKEATEIEETCATYVYEITKPAEKMVNALKKLLKREDINSNYVDSGSFKNCQKLTVGKYSYALSTFKKYPIFNERGYFREAHGKGNEAQSIFTAYKRFSQGRVCKPFLANLSAEAQEGGFILSKFIDTLHPLKVERGPFLQNRDALKNIDPLGNTIQGIFIEAGGFIYNKKHIQDPKLRAIWKEFATCIDTNLKLINSEASNKIHDFLLAASDCDLDICDTVILKNLLENKSQDKQKMAKKIVKNIERARLLKNNAIKNGTFEEIKKILKEDLCELFPFEEYSPEFHDKAELIDIYKNYPRLIAKELEINNIPPLKSMLKLMEDHFCMIDIDLSSYYTLKDAMEVFTKNYNEVKDWESLKIMAKRFGLEHRLT